ncbi:hypothetical protein [Pseudomonas tohonis]|uniref:hypothetical protein n=1 Tax=Pseudomonas tohonis TaxID=2725477 RepID=UPI0021DB6F79|nr:hypothetical protein [Pseudomonas tohonis]UXY50981.1 hypothetical protein N9L84_18645 [Pseudomonas tohonis]
MKHTCLIAIVALMAACSNKNPATLPVASNEAPSAAIQAFRDICLKSAPDFSQAAVVAKTFGVEVTDMGFMMAGFNADKSMSVQIQAGKECAVTTPSQRDESLTRQLLDSARDLSGTPVAQFAPSTVTLGGEVFILAHDRSGGEAYVLLKAKD